MTPLIAKIAKFHPSPEEFHWFDGGQSLSDDFAQAFDHDLLFHLPFQQNALVGVDADGNEFVLLIFQKKPEWVRVAGSVQQNNELVPIFPFSYELADGGLIIRGLGTLSKPSNDEMQSVKQSLAIIQTYLLLMRDKGALSYKPTRAGTPAQQAKRARHGKGPLLDWHTVTIQPKQSKAEPCGGTHASPRLHDRRGHWRKYPSGKTVWVRNCKVGDPSKGVVFKDYKL
jgi:hypothetical protein